MVDHKRVARIVHDHVLGEVQELPHWHVVLRIVLSCQKQEVVIKEDHAHDLHKSIVLQRHLRLVLIARQVLILKQSDFLQSAHLCFIVSL